MSAIVIALLAGVIFVLEKPHTKVRLLQVKICIDKLKEEFGPDLTKKEIQKIEAITNPSQAADVKTEIEAERKIKLQAAMNKLKEETSEIIQSLEDIDYSLHCLL